MANKPKPVEKNRRETVEAMRRQQRAAERRKTIIFVSVALVVGLALIAAVAVPTILKSINDPAKKAYTSLGVRASAASCGALEKLPATGGQDHSPEGEHVTYGTVPPTSGRHDGNFLTDARNYYSTKDTPPVEKLVHSLEHGYTILWYDDTVKGSALDTLKDISARANKDKLTEDRFIVAPLDMKRGKLPAGKHVALTHWGSTASKSAYRQVCASPSGEVVQTFIKAHPFTDAPEPGGV